MREGTPSLESFQQNFADYLLSSEPTHTHRNDMSTWLGADAADYSQRLAVYRNNVRYSLMEALTAQFPVVQRLVGEGFFALLARDYVQQHLPSEPSLTFYGDHFAEFIEQRADCSTAPYLADVTRLELADQRALHAEDCAPLQASELMTMPAEQLCECILPLHPSATLLLSPWPVQTIREENLREQPGVLQLDDNSTTCLLIYRKGEQVQIVTLQESAFALLQSLQQHTPLQQAWEQVQLRFALDDAELIPLLVYLLKLEVFINNEGVCP